MGRQAAGLGARLAVTGCGLVIAHAACDDAAMVSTDGTTTSGNATASSGSTGGNEPIPSGACLPSQPIGCPSVPVPECAEPILPAPSLWLDLEAEGVDAVEIVDLSYEDVLVELTGGEPAVVHPYGSPGPSLATVTSPHEAGLRAVGLVDRYALLCGPTSCALYQVGETELTPAPFSVVPLAADRVRGGVSRGGAAHSDEACDPAVGLESVICVYGDGVACLVDDDTPDWSTVVRPNNEGDFFDAAPLSDNQIRFVGQAGRMGRVVVSAASPNEIELTWVEEARLASADLLEIETSGAQTGIIGGTDGVFLRFYRDQFAACDTGDHDWRVSVGGWELLSTTGEVLGSACLASFTDGHVFSDATPFYVGTVWGFRYAEGLRVYEQVTGFTE